MNRYEKEVLQTHALFKQIQEEQAELIKPYYDAYHKAKERLLRLGKCSHKDTVEYKWESDSGYGVQRKMTGERCILCDKEFPYRTLRK